MKHNYYQVAELEIRLVCMETRRTGRVFFIHSWFGVWTKPGPWFL